MLEPVGRFLARVGRLVLLDRAADPAANGELQRNATDVKVYSGGAVRNLSDVGTAPAHTLASHSTEAHSELTAVGTDDHHAQLHAAAHKAAGGDALLLDELGTPTDVTTLDATTALHGLLLKLGGGTTNFLRADGTWSAPAGGSGAITREGGNATEASTTSTTNVDLLSLASISILAGVTIEATCNTRKSSGSATLAGTGSKLNTTALSDAALGNGGYVTSAGNQAEDGGVWYILGPRLTSNQAFGTGIRRNAQSSGGAGATTGVITEVTGSNNMPIATVTDFIITGNAGNASQTLYADELNVYERAIA